mgnify:CR=1 FL=1
METPFFANRLAVGNAVIGAWLKVYGKDDVKGIVERQGRPLKPNKWWEKAPHKICAYIYDLANAFNRFYHETKILSEENETRKAGFIALLAITKRVLEACIDVLGFEAPERM